MSMKKLFSMRNVMLAGAIACVAAFTVAPVNADAAKKAVKAVAEIEPAINYEDEIVNFVGGDSSKKKVFFAFSKKETTEDKIKNWDDVKKANGQAKIDISTYIGTKEGYIYYKDGADGGFKGPIKIAAAPKVSLDKKNANVNEGAFHLTDKAGIVTGSAYVEVKKGKRGDWKNWGSNEINGEPVTAGALGSVNVDMLNRWQKSGATIYVRAAATTLYPASNEVSAKISKLANGPKLTLDPIKVVAKMKKKTEYKVYPLNYSGDPDSDFDWIKVSDTDATDGIALKALADNANTTTGSALTIEYRTAKTDKKAASKTTVVSVSGQAVGPTIGAKDDKVAKIQMYTANLGSEKKPSTGTAIVANEDGYEYKIGTENLTKGWKVLKKDKLVKIKATQASDGKEILFRKKGIKANPKKDVKFEWASSYTEKKVNLK